MERLLQRVDKCLITCNEQLTLIKETRDWTECRALQKRGSCGKSTKSIYSVTSKRQKQRRPVVQSAGRIEKVKKTKFELDLIKIVDCFLDGHGKYDSNLVSFKVKSL